MRPIYIFLINRVLKFFIYKFLMAATTTNATAILATTTAYAIEAVVVEKSLNR